MFCINVWLTVKDPAHLEHVRTHLTDAARQSREEPGCLRFEVYQSEADPRRFLLCEHWASRESWEVHRTARTFTQIYQPQVLPYVDREPHISRQLV